MTPVVLLDGAMATQLAARGFALHEPLFSARALTDAPELVEAIHFDYLCAGAEVLTTNSFGLHASTLARAGVAEQQGALVRRSVEILAQVRKRALADFRIAGAIPMRPREQWGDDPAPARAEYRNLAEQLAEAGVDQIVLETFTSLTEAELALAGVAELGLPIWLSVVAGSPGARLLDGEPLAKLAALADRVDGLGINCTQLDAIPAALAALLAVTEPRALPIAVSPHFGKRREDGVWIDRTLESDAFAEQMHEWLRSARSGRAPLVLAGACCGSQPDDIAALRRRLQPTVV